MALKIFFLLGLGVYLAAPALMLSGWIRWVKRRGDKQEPFSILAFIGFAFASASFLLALGTIIAAHLKGGFPYYDPLLLRIYGWGLLLSLAGILFGMAGVWRSSAMRWFAPALAFVMFLFWLFRVAAE
jgi:hypothetical protein